MIKLQTPEFALRNGELIPWEDAVLHVNCEGVNRGLSVFEGIKGYWHADGHFGLLELRRHYDRLRQSARLLHIPCPWTFDEFEAHAFKLIRALVSTESDMWIRATLYVVEGHWGDGTKADLIMTAYNSDKASPRPINVGVSTWQRSLDNSLPYRIKATSNYQIGRIARIEGRSRDCQEMILLNQQGRVSEATGAAVLIVRDSAVITPCHTEGALESITVDVVEAIARSAGIQFVRRPVDRTELAIAEEICICGTLAELTPVKMIEDFEINPNGPIFGALKHQYNEIVHGGREHEDIHVTIVPI